MKLPSLAAVVLALCTGCSSLTKPPAASAPAQPPTVATLDSMAVALVGEDGDIHCSGTWIGRGKVLTAGHCVKEQEEVYWVRSNPGELPMPALRLKWDEDADLGLLLVAGDVSIHGNAELGPMPAVGDGLLSLNNTFRMENSFMRGYVGGYQVVNDRTYLEAMLPGSYGASGSGLFDVQGRLVGVASWKWGKWDGCLFYVNVLDIQKFLLN